MHVCNMLQTVFQGDSSGFQGESHHGVDVTCLKELYKTCSLLQQPDVPGAVCQKGAVAPNCCCREGGGSLAHWSMSAKGKPCMTRCKSVQKPLLPSIPFSSAS